MSSNSWILRQAGEARRLRLYCFCYAGGSAIVFLPWQAMVDPLIEICAVQLPGRGRRMDEQPYDQLSALIEDLAKVIKAEDQLPFAFFGHSLGGLIAFELARYCKQHHFPMPIRLFVSGCAAPRHRDLPTNLHLLPDDEFIGVLRDYNGTPSELLEHRELMEFVLPTVRADFALAEKYIYRFQVLLNVPISVLAGKLDDHSSLEKADGWRKETTGEFGIKWFQGDHFFVNTEQQSVVDFINVELADDIERLPRSLLA